MFVKESLFLYEIIFIMGNKNHKTTASGGIYGNEEKNKRFNFKVQKL